MRAMISVDRVLDAPHDLVYHCIADYRQHHRPGGFLPPAFSDLEITRGGVGAGTELHWVVDLGGRRRTVAATISEPDPGRRLVEDGIDVVTTFTVAPDPDGTYVRFDTTIDDPGLQGVLTRMFAGRLLRPIYDDELSRLEAVARSHPQRRTS
jgi:Polyketide cyclase / dehydrase and lipid transport